MTNQNDNETRTAPPPDESRNGGNGANGHSGSAAERYELGERIAVGGMGSVYAAKDKATGRDVAIKFLHEQHSADPGFVARFRDEARAAARVKHPNVVEVLDYGRWDDDRYYIAMEYVEGESLRHYIEVHGALPPHDAVEIMLQVTAAVEAAHKEGLVHGDLKPENILIRPDGTAKVVDFGLARAAAPGNVTRSAAALATAQYIAPEVVQGHAPTPSSDVYALGVVLYELLTGRPPFSGANAVSVAMQHLNEKPVPPHEINRQRAARARGDRHEGAGEAAGAALRERVRAAPGAGRSAAHRLLTDLASCDAGRRGDAARPPPASLQAVRGRRRNAGHRAARRWSAVCRLWPQRPVDRLTCRQLWKRQQPAGARARHA